MTGPAFTTWFICFLLQQPFPSKSLSQPRKKKRHGQRRLGGETEGLWGRKGWGEGRGGQGQDGRGRMVREREEGRIDFSGATDRTVAIGRWKFHSPTDKWSFHMHNIIFLADTSSMHASLLRQTLAWSAWKSEILTVSSRDTHTQRAENGHTLIPIDGKIFHLIFLRRCFHSCDWSMKGNLFNRSLSLQY